MDRLLRGAAAIITVTVTAAGEPVAADSPPTVTVTRDTGEILASGVSTATEAPCVYEFQLTGAQTALVDVVEARWTASIDSAASVFITNHEIVGGFVTSIAAIEDSLPNMSGPAAPTAEDMDAARTLAEDWLEDECGVAFRPRYAHDRLDGNGTELMLLSQPQVIALRSVSVNGEPAASYYFYPSGEIRGTAYWAEGFQNVDVVYEHGYPTVPSQVARAATLLARYFLVPDPSDYDARATSISTETAHYSLITPGVREAITAIPEVNVVMSLFNFIGIQ